MIVDSLEKNLPFRHDPDHSSLESCHVENMTLLLLSLLVLLIDQIEKGRLAAESVTATIAVIPVSRLEARSSLFRHFRRKGLLQFITVLCGN